VRREHRKLTRAELASITGSRPVVRKLKGPGKRGNGCRVSGESPDARKKFYPNRKHMFVPSEGGRWQKLET
jgi:hypothetical protein